MSYLAWRKENEDKYRELVNDGKLELFPGFKESAFNDLSNTVIAPVVESMLENQDMTLIHFASVFAEYLFEEYGVVPADLEVLVQYVSLATIQQVKKTSEQVSKMIIEGIHQHWICEDFVLPVEEFEKMNRGYILYGRIQFFKGSTFSPINIDDINENDMHAIKVVHQSVYYEPALKAYNGVHVGEPGTIWPPIDDVSYLL